jgi:hypothetical protein
MRALDLLEKIAHDQVDLVQPYKQAFLGPLADSDKWEIRLQIVRALPLLQWTADERPRAIQILRENRVSADVRACMGARQPGQVRYG